MTQGGRFRPVANGLDMSRPAHPTQLDTCAGIQLQVGFITRFPKRCSHTSEPALHDTTSAYYDIANSISLH